MLEIIKRRSKEDKGNAIIILGLMLIMVTLIIGGMMLDISKAYQLKSAYVDSARKATQAGIREQNTEGFLKAEAALEAIRVYETVARPSVIKDGYMSHCNGKNGERSVDITINFMDGGINNGYANIFEKGRHSVTMNSSNINNDDTLSTLMSKSGLSDNTRREIENSRYKGLELEVIESTPNVILPGASKIAATDNDIDFNCQVLGIREGASQYIGETGSHY